MSWLLEASGASDAQGLLAQRADLGERYTVFLQTLLQEGDLSLRTLTLCRRRIEAIHGVRDGWTPGPLSDESEPLGDAVEVALEHGLNDANRNLFTASERAALAVAELMPHGQHQISDQQISELQDQLGAKRAVALLTALAFFDVNTRLGLSLGLSQPSSGEQ